ncbi:uncharacterized protein [Diabrotica undecimpunctata]|uniref:uncharacterized protein n=1 Tax=Diabrotica undecimpunctata TaxID=50387 RepID=UPI003B6372E9
MTVRGNGSNNDNGQRDRLKTRKCKLIWKHGTKKLNKYTEKILGEYQAEFRSNRSTIDQIFALKEIQTTCYEHKIAVYVLLVDFKQAYDTVKRHPMYGLMKEMGLPSKLVRMVKVTMDNSTNEIAWKGHKSNNLKKRKD